jgi:hypothetical protein
MQPAGNRKACKSPPFSAALAVFLISIFSISAAAAQQSEISMSGKINMLNYSGTHASRTTFLEKLGIPKDVAKAATSSRSPERELRWQPVHTATPGRTALLFIPSISNTQSAYLYLLHRAHRNWTVTDHRNFACPFSNDVSMTLTRLHSSQYKSILVRNIATGWGTGVMFKNFEILDVRNEHFYTILSTQSYLDSDPWPSMIPTHVRSRFIVVPAKSSTARAIEEISSTTHKHHLTVKRRYFLWSQSKQKYRPTPFQLVQAP